MRALCTLWVCLFLPAAGAAALEEVVLQVDDPGGAAGRVGAPVSVPVDLEALFGPQARPPSWFLEEVGGEPDVRAHPRFLPSQFEPDAPGSNRGRLWWLMPAGPEGRRQFKFSLVMIKMAPVWEVQVDRERQRVDLKERQQPVLRYNHGTVPVPEGTHPHFAAGESYARGDYISPLFGPDGEELTEDYPRDHPHHRGVWWSWPVTRWGEQVADIWAVRGVWSRPVALRRVEARLVLAVIRAENCWKFGKDETPIVREEVVIRAFRQTGRSRFVDVEVALTALVDGVAIGGRPKAGYGGFSLRAAPCKDRQITPHADPAGANPRRAWIDYSGVFPGGKGPAGVTLLEHVTNPDYPSDLHQYPGCNCVMPAFPGAREVALSKEKPLVLKHRLWIHPGGPEEAKLADVWASYAEPPKVNVVKE